MLVALSDERENLRIRVLETTNAALTDFCERKRINKQDTIDGLLAWFLTQDGMLQSLILGQIDEQYRAQVARLVLDRMAEEPAPKPPVKFDAVAAAIRSAPEHAEPAPETRRRGRGGRRG